MSTTNHGYVAQPYRNPASRLETLLPGQPHPIQDEEFSTLAITDQIYLSL